MWWTCRSKLDYWERAKNVCQSQEFICFKLDSILLYPRITRFSERANFHEEFFFVCFSLATIRLLSQKPNLTLEIISSKFTFPKNVCSITLHTKLQEFLAKNKEKQIYLNCFVTPKIIDFSFYTQNTKMLKLRRLLYEKNNVSFVWMRNAQESMRKSKSLTNECRAVVKLISVQARNGSFSAIEWIGGILNEQTCAHAQ